MIFYILFLILFSFSFSFHSLHFSTLFWLWQLAGVTCWTGNAHSFHHHLILPLSYIHEIGPCCHFQLILSVSRSCIWLNRFLFWHLLSILTFYLVAHLQSNMSSFYRYYVILDLFLFSHPCDVNRCSLSLTLQICHCLSISFCRNSVLMIVVNDWS